MNEFTAKKMGEVMAFARVGKETAEKGHVALAQVLGNEMVRAMIDVAAHHASVLEDLAVRSEIREAVMKKADATSEKLRAMRSLYLKEEDWSDPAELLEWSGFFEGAAIVHWGLVQGAARSLALTELLNLAESARTLHENFLDQTTESIRRLAEEKIPQ